MEMNNITLKDKFFSIANILNVKITDVEYYDFIMDPLECNYNENRTLEEQMKYFIELYR